MKFFWEAYLRVMPTRNGKGIITTQLLVRDQVIYYVRGNLMTSEQTNAIGDECASNSYRYDEEYYLSPAGEIGDFLNHSCTPNAYVSRDYGVLAVRAIGDIHPGEEITIDYSTIIADDDEWVMRCDCGAATCRGHIGSFSELPRSVRKKYQVNHWVPDYILAINRAYAAN